MKNLDNLKDVLNFINNLNDEENLKEVMRYSIETHKKKIAVPRIYESCVLEEAIDKVRRAYEEVKKEYLKY